MRAIYKVGNEFEQLAAKSFQKKELVLITLENDKFYIGWIKELPIPALSNYVRIIPAISGVRDKNKRLKFVSHYLNTYFDFLENKEVSYLDQLDTDVVLRIEHIISLSFFNFSIYHTLNASTKGVKKKV